jgi:murein DD-endopeptidase MepM/ murein hydrolase activator NlpD
MRSPRYTILIANRRTGVIRRLTVSRRTIALSLTVLLGVPTLVALGSRGADVAELEALRGMNDSLRLENDSYREATGELTTQISALQSALGELSREAELDPATRRAIENLPAVVRSRAAGGSPNAATGSTAAPAATEKEVPESTFGILRDLLGSLQSRLETVRSRIESDQALARATPSLPPIAGWLTSAFGTRKDPFTGQPDFHSGIDLSANRGTPIKATADGTVQSAAYQGNYGNAVVVDHGFGLATRYGHMSGFRVRPGQKVRRGEVIGYVGSTGRATSSHLHYEILLNGQPINPLRLLAK